MAKDRDTKTDFDEAYKQGHSAWQPYLAEAEIDLDMYLNKQWDANTEKWLRDQKREAYVFNQLKRVIKIVSGYERRNRLVLKVGGVENEDDLAASQHTAVLLNIMNSDSGYPWMVVSDAFKYGTCIEGMNLINFWPDRRGDIKFARNPFNSFLLDPTFTKINLSDCNYLLRRELVTKDDAKRILPESAAKQIDKIQLKGTDDKYPQMPRKMTLFQEDLAPYDEFWRRITRKEKLVLFRGPGWHQWSFKDFAKLAGGETIANQILADHPLFTSIEDYVDTVELNIFYAGELVWTGEDPYGIGDYPHVLVIGDWAPEHKKSKYKCQGLIRAGRDPQKADNKRLSQMVDIFESHVQTGWKAKEDALVDREQLYKTGQGKQIWVKKDADIQDVEQLRGSDIPPGMFQLHQIFERMTFEIPGANQELFGTEEKDIPFVLGKLRTGAALTVFQDYFDNLRYAKKQMGCKLVRMVQSNFPPQKVQRITNEKVAPGFYEPDFVRFDCTLQEGLLTDTQRQMAYAELRHLRSEGAPIPWAAILDMAPIQLKHKIKQIVMQAEKQQSGLAQQEAQDRQLTQKAQQAKIAADLGRAQERTANVQEHHADAALARVKTMKEIEQMDWDRVMQLLERLAMFEKQSTGITKR